MDSHVPSTTTTDGTDHGTSKGSGTQQEDSLTGPVHGAEHVQTLGNDRAACGVKGGFAGNAPGRTQRFLDAQGERGAGELGILCLPKSMSQLVRDLALADHHGIKACSHTKQVRQSIVALVNVPCVGSRVDPGESLKNIGCCDLGGIKNELNPVAGGKCHNAVHAEKIAQRFRQEGDIKGRAFNLRQAVAVMLDGKNAKVHSSPSQACACCEVGPAPSLPLNGPAVADDLDRH